MDKTAEVILEALVANNILKKESINNNIYYILYNSNIASKEENKFIEIDSYIPTYSVPMLHSNKEEINVSNKIPLKVKVMNDLATGTYIQQIGTLTWLWGLLFGEADAKTIATLVGKFGGYKNGGCTRLAKEMLQLAAWDGNPTAVLMSKAIKGKQEEAKTTNMYPDFSSMNTTVRKASEVLEVDF